MLDIFLVQMEVAPNDKAKNFETVRRVTADIQCDGKVGGLIVLPEMFATGYLPLHPESAAEDFSSRDSGETANFLSDLANRTGYSVLGAGIAIRDGKLLNHSSVFQPGNPNEFAGYDKRHPFFMEQPKFAAGTDVNLFKISHWKVAATICFDLRFPELYRDAVKAGAKLITVQAAWPAVRIEHWKTLLQARAIEDQVYIAAVNCTGHTYGGRSMIISPQGEIMEMADENSSVLVKTRIFSVPQQEYRQKFPVLNGIVQTGLI
ncbi:nitrilase-related carbon-nitrogen hydrolase [uncultured Fibrobacter sp.]|uniref:nitrilase-related carbon-nitrogen hydrolase n=1 Tax=uncultured Fibrobacter sp. TaxID=261512 RepID=UPI0026256BA0|nr:nitrilase-related carbon-nitrogen hydrolase [uncultured Fibrobacter sp.]